jgi:serine/threonine protein kinase
MEPLQPGDPTRISTYEILNRLGAGGMGQVYLGRSASGRRVAVKVIRPELTSDPEFRARFRREVTSMKAVSGFFTAPVVDADPDGTPAWLATAFVPGPSLSEAVRDRGPMPQRDVLVLAAGLAEALSAIHREGLTHRDLKPANVLLADDGPRVIDFGLAVTATSSAGTQAGTVVGTPSFMSPEQINGKQVGPSSDVFSLGSVLVHAATGRTPYGEGGTMELMYRVVNNEPDLAGISGTLLHLVTACLHKDPAQRPTPARILQVLSDGAGVEATAAMGWVPPKLAQTPSQAPAYVPPPTQPQQHLQSPPKPHHQPVRPVQAVQPVQRDSGPQATLSAQPGQRDSGPRAAMPAPYSGGGVGSPGGYGPSTPSYRGGPPAKKNRTTVYAITGSVVAVATIAGVGIAMSGGGNPTPNPTAPASSTAAQNFTPGTPINVDISKLFGDADAAKYLKAGLGDIDVGIPSDGDNSTSKSHDETWDGKVGSPDTFLNSVRIQATAYKDKTNGPNQAADAFAKNTSGSGFSALQVTNAEKAKIQVAPDPGDNGKANSLQHGSLEILRGNVDITITFNEMKVSTADAQKDLTGIAALIGGRLPSS